MFSEKKPKSNSPYHMICVTFKHSVCCYRLAVWGRLTVRVVFGLIWLYTGESGRKHETCRGSPVLNIEKPSLSILHIFSYTVYSFEFAQSYFRPMEIWDWFAKSWIRPLSNFLTYSFMYYSISPVLNSPSGQRAKRVKIKRGRNFPCIQYTCLYRTKRVFLNKLSLSVSRAKYKNRLMLEVQNPETWQVQDRPVLIL